MTGQRRPDDRRLARCAPERPAAYPDDVTLPAVDVLRVRTVQFDPEHGAAEPLLDLLPERDGLAWVHDGEGLVGWGVAARVELAGPERFAEAQR